MPAFHVTRIAQFILHIAELTGTIEVVGMADEVNVATIFKNNGNR